MPPPNLPPHPQPEHDPCVEIIPDASIRDSWLRQHRSPASPRQRLHLHYPGRLLPHQRQPFYVRVPAPGEPATPVPPLPQVEVLDEEGRTHPRLWATFFGHGRLDRNGDLQVLDPPTATDRGEALEYAYLLMGPHTPWAEEHAWVQASTTDSSAKMELILAPALESESMTFAKPSRRSAMCILVVPPYVQREDASVEFWNGERRIEVTATSTDIVGYAPAFPLYGVRGPRSWRVLRWSWGDLPWPPDRPRARVRVRFPGGLLYDHTLVPGHGER